MLSSEKNRILYELTSMEELAKLVVGDPVMELPYRQKIEELRLELQKREEEVADPRALLYFHGDPVKGSIGIEANFISDTLAPFQQMISSRVSSLYRKIPKKGKLKDFGRSKLYLTSLPRGSFGVELRKLDNEDLFDGRDVTRSIHEVIDLISASENREEFIEKSVGASDRELSALKKFFLVLKKSNAGVTLEADGIHKEFSKDAVSRAYSIISEIIVDVNEIQIIGRFTGIFLKSRTFEFITTTDQRITGSIHNNLDTNEIESFAHDLLDRDCIGIFEKKVTNQVDGESVPQYTLMSLAELDE